MFLHATEAMFLLLSSFIGENMALFLFHQSTDLAPCDINLQNAAKQFLVRTKILQIVHPNTGIQYWMEYVYPAIQYLMWC